MVFGIVINGFFVYLGNMPRYDDRYDDRYGSRRHDDRYGTTRLYVGHLSSRTRSRDLEDIFSRYGR